MPQHLSLRSIFRKFLLIFRDLNTVGGSDLKSTFLFWLGQKMRRPNARVARLWIVCKQFEIRKKVGTFDNCLTMFPFFQKGTHRALSLAEQREWRLYRSSLIARKDIVRRTATSWNVSSQSCPGKSYIVRRNHNQCNKQKCTEVPCTHIYTCECFDRASTPCKHVHAVHALSNIVPGEVLSAITSSQVTLLLF